MKLKREMRRRDRAILDMDYVESILREAPLGVLSLSKEDNPYSIPVNFYYEDGRIFIHCAKEGQKVLYMKANPRACFLIVHPVDVPVTYCNGTVNYESVLCFGRTAFSETSPRDILLKLGKKYNNCPEVTEKDCQDTAMIEMEIDEVSAKRGYEL